MLNRWVAVVGMLLAFTSGTGAQTLAEPPLAKGIAEVQADQWAKGVSTLNDVVKRLSAMPARTKDVAQAYLWLGIAYAQLDSEKASRASFREALKRDSTVSLGEGWPLKVLGSFGAAKGDAMLESLATRTPDAAWLSGSREMHGTTPGDSPEEKAVYEKAEWLTDGNELDEAEVLLRDWMFRHPKSGLACGQLATLLYRRSLWGRTFGVDDELEVAGHCAAVDDPTNATSRQALASAYWEPLANGYWRQAASPQLRVDLPGNPARPVTEEEKRRNADLAFKYANLALEIQPNWSESKLDKELFLRVKASTEKDETKRSAYVDEANRLRAFWAKIRESQKTDTPPRPPATNAGVTGGIAEAIRVAGDIKEPKKLKDVRPVYPPIARSARVQGVVILECTIGPQGNVVNVKVLEGIPLLHQAAIDAVKQWLYTPTLLNGVPVPVIMTVTVDFKLT